MNINNYLKIIGKKNLIETKPFKIQGINPKLTLTYTGKEIELPRFASPEMKLAQEMNKISHNQIINPIKRVYSKATKKDLSRLTSTTIKDSYSRAEWTNPKDGKIYNLLKTKENSDGTISIRILDQEGLFIKEAQIKPKTILIPDNYTEKKFPFNLSHGEQVLAFARRNNPFAKYIQLPISKDEIINNKTTEIISKYLKQNNNVDYISLSIGREVNFNKKIDFIEKISTNYDYYLDSALKPNQRMLISAGNGNPEEKWNIEKLSNRYLCFNQRVEGVGSLNSYNGTIAGFSQSRNSQLTQHYELGEFTPKLTKYGLNITGLPGTDLPLPQKILKRYTTNPLLGIPIPRVEKLLKNIDNNISYIKNKQKQILKEEKNILKRTQDYLKLEKQKLIYKARKLKIKYYAEQFHRIDGEYNIAIETSNGTSFSSPIRTAKLALNDMMENIL